MRPRVHSQAAYAEIETVARKRDELPTDSEIARKHGMTRAYVSYLMLQARKKLPVPLFRKKPLAEEQPTQVSEGQVMEMSP